jgi:hypothetical protein
MQEAQLLIHLIFTALECYALLVDDLGLALVARLVTLGLVAWCHCARRLTLRHHQYYTQLLYMFMALDLLAYPCTLVTAQAVQWRPRRPTWPYLLLLWLQAWARLYGEKRGHVNPEKETHDVASRDPV